MKTFGIVSYNIYCNFTNYGSALQSWALSQSIGKLGYKAKLIDYCPEVLVDKDPLNPFKNMWDQDEESQLSCELTMPAIRENYWKFDKFYKKNFSKTTFYTAKNFEETKIDVDAYVCGSDTIFSPNEFGMDDGFYANFECMKNNSIAYAASFGDPEFTEETYQILNERLKNFKAIGLRENFMIPYVKKQITTPVKRVLDPTLLLTQNDYDQLVVERQIEDKYLLIYARRHNPEMEDYAIKLAEKYKWKIVEISLRAKNTDKGHFMRYDAGVEEFLSLVKNAEYVVTNSFHGMIFSVQFRRPFDIFSREQCDTKIIELLGLLGLHNKIGITAKDEYSLFDINYEDVHARIAEERKHSIDFLRMALECI